MNRLSSIFNPIGPAILQLKKPCFSRFLDFGIALLLRMLNSDSLSKLIYQHEVLRAQQEMREEHLNVVIREIYENIGQMLSLANMEVGMLEEEDSDLSRPRVKRIGELVRKAIGDLRQMSNNLYPDLNGLKLDTLVELVRREILLLQGTASDLCIKTDGENPVISFEKGLILFRVIKEILTALSKNGNLICASAGSHGEDLTFNIQFRSEHKGLNWQEEVSDEHLTTEQKIKLIGGTLQIGQEDTATNIQQITIHLKNCCNE